MFMFWNKASKTVEGYCEFSTHDLIGVYALLHIIHVEIIIIGCFICIHICMGRHGSHMGALYMRGRVIMVLNNQTLVWNSWTYHWWFYHSSMVRVMYPRVGRYLANV